MLHRGVAKAGLALQVQVKKRKVQVKKEKERKIKLSNRFEKLTKLKYT